MNIDFEVVNAYIALVAVLVNLTLAAWVILRSKRSLIYTTFMFLCLSVAFWNFGDFMVYASGEGLWLPAGSVYNNPWKYYSSTGSAMAVAFLFHFACALVRGIRKFFIFIFLAYVCSSFLAVTSPLAIYYRPIRSFVDGTTWNIMFGVVLAPFITAGLLIMTNALMHAESEGEKSRWRYAIISIVITVVAGFTDLVQKLQFPVPPLGHIGSVIGPGVLAVGIFRHRHVFDVLTRTRVRLKALGEMAASIAHEIRNPLTAVKGAVNLQAEELESGNWEESRKYQGIIADEIQRLDSILASYQDFTRPIILDKEIRSVNEILEKTVSLASMQELNIRILSNWGSGIPQCEVDPSLLQQVFINLILNSTQACGPDCDLHITSSWAPPWIVVDFKDNGPGIPPSKHKLVFEPFYTTKKEGIGIGLAVCRRIVEAHAGRIELTRDGSKGAHFQIYLPDAG